MTLEDLLAMVMIEEALEARERRLWIRAQRRVLWVETVCRLVLTLAIVALAIAGVGIVLPR